MRRLSLLAILVLVAGQVACSDDDNSNCVDNDGDGYGVGTDCAGPDCDDTDPNVWDTITGYPDADGDGVFSPNAEQVCATTLPADYSETAGTDCDDSDADVWQLLAGYPDEDGDGYGAADATAMDICSGDALPAGYVDNGTDCDDSNDTIWATMTGYADADADGHYSEIASTLCTDGTLLQGYSDTPGDDCNDTDPFWWNAALDQWGYCEVAGPCFDIEMLGGSPDGYGVGSCPLGVDCNAADPTCNEPVFEPVGAAACDPATPSDCNVGELCLGPAGSETCHEVPGCCNNDPTTGYTCSELSDTTGTGCLQVCPALPANPTNSEVLAYATCLQDCIDAATPLAQYLYGQLQNCLATNGCFVVADEVTCATTHCAAAAFACLGDVPSP